jgi:hypothetical protein
VSGPSETDGLFSLDKAGLDRVDRHRLRLVLWAGTTLTAVLATGIAGLAGAMAGEAWPGRVGVALSAATAILTVWYAARTWRMLRQRWLWTFAGGTVLMALSQLPYLGNPFEAPLTFGWMLSALCAGVVCFTLAARETERIAVEAKDRADRLVKEAMDGKV